VLLAIGIYVNSLSKTPFTPKRANKIKQIKHCFMLLESGNSPNSGSSWHAIGQAKRDACSGSRSMSSWLRDAGQAKLIVVDMDLTRTRYFCIFPSIQFFFFFFFFQSTSSKHNSRYLLSLLSTFFKRIHTT
jgi:hypothetical protein